MNVIGDFHQLNNVFHLLVVVSAPLKARFRLGFWFRPGSGSGGVPGSARFRSGFGLRLRSGLWLGLRFRSGFGLRLRSGSGSSSGVGSGSSAATTSGGLRRCGTGASRAGRFCWGRTGDRQIAVLTSVCLHRCLSTQDSSPLPTLVKPRSGGSHKENSVLEVLPAVRVWSPS